MFYWSTEGNWRQCVIMDHPKKSQKKAISLKSVLLNYWSKLEIIFYHRSVSTNHITQQSFSEVLCWSTEVSKRLGFISKHCQHITLYKNRSQKCLVEVLRWVGDYVSVSNIVHKSHHKTINLIKVLLKYWGELETMFQYRSSSTIYVTKQSTSSGFCWSAVASRRQYFIIEHDLNKSHGKLINLTRFC
jgi:hypothetical protein